jgi:signal transduction histidine kinase
MTAPAPEGSAPPRPLRVLLVEDTEDDAALILAMLRRAGYAPDHRRVQTADALRAALREEAWEIVLSDYSMPGFSGPEALRIVHESSLDLPFIIVSATIGEQAAVEAMRAGAHDYLMKGNLARLGPAVERELREADVRRERHRAALALEEDARVFAALARVGRELIAFSDTAKLLARLAELLIEVLPCDCSYVLLRQSDDAYVPVAVVGCDARDEEELRALKLPPAAVAGLLAALREHEAVQVSTAEPPTPWAALPLRFGVTRILYLALHLGGSVIGIHAVGFRGRHEPFTAAQERIARGSAQLASMALQAVRLVEELASANRVKSDFVATMSHELRTPLNILMGYTDLLLGEEFGPLTAEQGDVLARMERTARELLDLITATLDLSRLERGDVRVDWEDAHLPRLLRALQHDVRTWGSKPGVEIAWAVGVDLPAIRTDPGKLTVVLRNLLSNALKFTPQGTVTVSARPRDNGVEIAVADTGVGIAPEILPIIFEPFRQGESALTRRFGGVGLGLYIVRRLLSLLRGTIAVESTPGKGSIFRVWLPAT